MEVTKDKLKFYVNSCRIANETAVGLCIKTSAESCAYNKVAGYADCACSTKSLDDACVSYVLFKHVEDKLCGNPLASKSSRVVHVESGVSSGYLILSWSMKGVMSHVRKALAIAIKALVPSKLYSAYQLQMRSMELTPKREYFNNAVHKLIPGINALECFAIGKLNKFDNAVVKDVATLLASKVPDDAAGKERSENKNPGPACTHPPYVNVNIKGYKQFVAADYIKTLSKVPIQRCNTALIIPLSTAAWDRTKSKLADRLTGFIDQKYSKLGNELGCYLAYMAAARAELPLPELKDLATLKLAEVKAAIKASL